jgi:BRCT domain type II-containing protein
MASTKVFTKNHHSSNPSSNSFFHQQQASSSSTNPNIDEDTTLTQEMHVKMAKKIAQLTKVSLIYLYLFLSIIFK